MSNKEEIEKWFKDYEPTYKEKILEVLKEKPFISISEIAIKLNPTYCFDEALDIAVSGVKLEDEGLVETLFCLKMKNGTIKTFNKIEDISNEDATNSDDLIQFLRLL